jgi:hypothetical protein
MFLFTRRNDHFHSWGPELAYVPGNGAGVMLVQFCGDCGKRRRIRA